MIVFAAIVAVAGCGSSNSCEGPTDSGATTTGGSGGSPVSGATGGSRGVGSGGSLGAGGSGVAPLSSPAGFGPAFEHAMCALVTPCGAYLDVATCEADTVFAESSFLQTVVTDVQRGIVRYDAIAAAACIAALPRDCQTSQKFPGLGATYTGAYGAYNLFEVIPACAGVFTGEAGPGQPCSLWLDCTPAAPVCGRFPPCDQVSSCCPATCQTPGDGGVDYYVVHAAGESCRDDGLCLLPSVCDANSGTCVVPPAEGASCDATAAFPCGRMDDYCSSVGVSTHGTCVRRLSVGASCVIPPVADACIWSAPCYTDSRTGQSTCYAFAGLGSPCAANTRCPGHLFCGANGTCGVAAPGPNCAAARDGGT
jgi:hypothetical protein